MATSYSILRPTPTTGVIIVSARDEAGDKNPVAGAWIGLYREPTPPDMATWTSAGKTPVYEEWTDSSGIVPFEIEPGGYVVRFGHRPGAQGYVELKAGDQKSLSFDLPLSVTTDIKYLDEDRKETTRVPEVGYFAEVTVSSAGKWPFVPPEGATEINESSFTLRLRDAGTTTIRSTTLLPPEPDLASMGIGDAEVVSSKKVSVDEERVGAPFPVRVGLARTDSEATDDTRLWGAIAASAEAMSFAAYDTYMDRLFCRESRADGRYTALLDRRFLPFSDTDAYRALKVATEAFVTVNCGVLERGPNGGLRKPEDFLGYLSRRGLTRPSGPYLELVNGRPLLPYLAIIRRRFPEIRTRARDGDDSFSLCDEYFTEKLTLPCLLELIWSYWHEEAMQVQTMNVITRRFQNLRGANEPDPLANMEVNPLRPLNNLLWGWIQDEQHRLTVARRNAEYDHHYGLRLQGRAVQGFRGADTRSKFIAAFHHLLRLCTEFYKQDDDTTVKADAFGVLNALKEVHLILSQGAHCQFGDLPPTARIEMLMQQWLLARPEFREFLPSRAMVAYPEAWMDRVDAMKKLQGWTDTSVIHFHNLAVFGEQLLLAIRYGAWSTVYEPTQAFNFARFWRPQVQGYIHAYRAATGAEIGAPTVTEKVDATLPSVLLQRRLSEQRRGA